MSFAANKHKKRQVTFKPDLTSATYVADHSELAEMLKKTSTLAAKGGPSETPVPEDMEAVDVPGDGNCFFASLSLHVHYSAQELRQAVLHYASVNPEVCLPNTLRTYNLFTLLYSNYNL